MSAHSADDIRKHVRIYLGVFAALMILTVLTVTAARAHLAIPLAVTVALIIAIAKGSLVASFFMHLVTEKKVIFGALLLTVLFLIALLFLPLLGLSDQVTVNVLR